MAVLATHTKVFYQGDGATRKCPYGFSFGEGKMDKFNRIFR